MAEKKIAKVTLNGETLIDISEDTVAPEVLAESETAHDRSGEGIVGTAQFGGDTSDCYKITDAVGTIDDADYIPFNDVSDAEVPKKKTLFSAIVDKLKTVFAQKTDLKTHSYEVGTEIPSNVDLDDYTTEGVFYILTISVAETISNLPVVHSGKLIVIKKDTGDRVNQLFIDNDNNYYTRLANNNLEWSDWKQFANIDDISPSSVGDGYAEGTVNGSAITATISGFKLRPGVIVAIKINNEISVACTLNINSTGAKSIKYWSNEDPTNGKPIGASRITTFMYDGTYYRVLSKDRTPAVAQQSYVADTSGNIVLDWGYGSDRAQLKHNIGLGRLMYNFYKNSAWRGDKQLVDVTGNQTMEGWLKLPAGNGMTIASGAHAVGVQDTIPNIINELRFSNGAWGSFNLGTAYNLNYTTIPTGWYNYFYIPHRVGGENWAIPTSWFSDNVGYGTLMLFGMNNSNGMFRIRWHWGNSAIQIDELEDLQKGNMYVGTCSTAADQRAKVASVDGNFVLRKGVRVAIKFTNTNTYSSSTDNPITLNVNSTGAKNIYYGTTHSGAGNAGTNTRMYGVANRYVYYFYDGSYWVWDGCTVDDNTTYSVITADQISAGTDTASRVVRADYLNNGIRKVMGSLRGLNIDILDNNGKQCYLLFADVTTWYNSTTTGQATQSFEGLLFTTRGGGNMRNYIAHIGLGVSYQKVSAPDNLNLILKSSSSLYVPCILNNTTNNKYYLALRCRVVGVNAGFIGKWLGIDPNSITSNSFVICTDTSGTLPSGWSVAIDAGNKYQKYSLISNSETRAMGFGICSSSASNPFTALNDQYVLKTGGYVTVKFNADCPANATLNINGEGAKAIWYREAAITAGKIKSGDRATFVYNGTQYELVANDRWGNISGAFIYTGVNQNISVTCDGTKTVSTLLKELYAKFVSLMNGLGSNERIEVYALGAPNLGNMTAEVTGSFIKTSYPTQLKFGGTNAYSDGNLLIGFIRLEASSPFYVANNKTASSDSYSDWTNSVWSSGNSFVLYYKKMIQI